MSSSFPLFGKFSAAIFSNKLSLPLLFFWYNAKLFLKVFVSTSTCQPCLFWTNTFFCQIFCQFDGSEKIFSCLKLLTNFNIFLLIVHSCFHFFEFTLYVTLSYLRGIDLLLWIYRNSSYSLIIESLLDIYIIHTFSGPSFIIFCLTEVLIWNNSM